MAPTNPYHPFSDSIMSAPLPKRFELPRIPQYDGSSDPNDHLAMFNAHMFVYGTTTTDPIMCRVFPCTLTNFALRWFSTLPPNSINNYSQFTTKFLTHFALSKTYPKMVTTSLANLKQRPDESLENYLRRFNQEAIQVDDLSHELYIHLVIANVKSGPFLDSLAKKPPLNLDELRRRATGYINVEVYNKRRLRDRSEEEMTPRRTRRGRNDATIGETDDDDDDGGLDSAIMCSSGN